MTDSPHILDVPIESLEAAERACNEDYKGIHEYEFLSAFDRLCEQAGGFRNGLKLAEKLMKEQV